MPKKVSSIFSRLYMDYLYDNLRKIFSRFDVKLSDLLFFVVDGEYDHSEDFASFISYNENDMSVFSELTDKIRFNYDNVLHRKYNLIHMMDFKDEEDELEDLLFKYEKTSSQVEFIRNRLSCSETQDAEESKADEEWLRNAEKTTLKSIESNIKYKVELKTIVNMAKKSPDTAIVSLLYNENNIRGYALVLHEKVSEFKRELPDNFTFEKEHYSNNTMLRYSVEELVFYFLSHYMNLESFNGSEYYNTVIDITELIDKAANRLFHDSFIPFGLASDDLYSLINDLSVSKYEGKSVKGSIVFCDKKYMKILVPFVAPIPLNFDNRRKIRKLLEITNKRVSLLSDCRNVYGLGEARDTGEQIYYKVNFLDHFNWEFIKCSYELDETQLIRIVSYIFEAKYGRPNIYKMSKFETNFEPILSAEFSELAKHPHKADIIRRFNELINAAVTQKHGTMVVIMDHAEEEVERFQGSCIEVPKIELNQSIMKLVTAIDGAVLFNTEGQCLAIGVILDGRASGDETAARGARYNSAIRYLNYQREEKKNRCLIVVVSEDGDVECLYTNKNEN